MHSLLILRAGHLCFEAHWAPYRPDEPRLLYSLSKMFLSAATGLAVADGAFSYDDPIAELLAGAATFTDETNCRRAVFRWATRYNTRRRHTWCGYLSPSTYEARRAATLPTAA